MLRGPPHLLPGSALIHVLPWTATSRRFGRLAPFLGVMLVASSMLGVACPLTAQGGDLSMLSPGDSVRVRLRGGIPVPASFGAWNEDVMLLTVQGLGQDWPVSIYDMESLDIYRARTPQEGFRQGVLIGAVAGVFVGAAVGLVLHSTGVSFDPDLPSDQQILATSLRWAGIVAAAGGVVGGFVGGSHPGIGWVHVDLPRR